MHKQLALTRSFFFISQTSFVTLRLPLAAIIFIFSKGSRELILHCLLKIQFVEIDMKSLRHIE